MDVSKPMSDVSKKMSKLILEAMKDPKSKEENGVVTRRAIAKYVKRRRRPAFDKWLSARLNQLADEGLLVKVRDGRYMLPNPKAPDSDLHSNDMTATAINNDAASGSKRKRHHLKRGNQNQNQNQEEDQNQEEKLNELLIDPDSYAPITKAAHINYSYIFEHSDPLSVELPPFVYEAMQRDIEYGKTLKFTADGRPLNMRTAP